MPCKIQFVYCSKLLNMQVKMFLANETFQGNTNVKLYKLESLTIFYYYYF